jgi:hypothetical protein
MIHRLALLAGAFAATGILSFAAGVSTVAPAADPAAVVAAIPAAAPISAPAAAPPAVKTVTDTIYVAPVPEQAVIHVSQQAPQLADVTPSTRAAAPPQPRTSEREREHEDENGGENEGGEDDGGDD